MKRLDVLSTRTVFDDRFRIIEATLRYELPDGTMSGTERRLSFERGDSAAAVVFDPDLGCGVLVRQFRFPTSAKGTGWTLEIVAGIIESSESPEECIQREIREEIGCEIQSLEPIATFFLSPGGSSERVFLFAARVKASELAATGGNPAESEGTEVVTFPLDGLTALFESSEIADAKTMIGLGWLERRCAVPG